MVSAADQKVLASTPATEELDWLVTLTVSGEADHEGQINREFMCSSSTADQAVRRSIEVWQQEYCHDPDEDGDIFLAHVHSITLRPVRVL